MPSHQDSIEWIDRAIALVKPHAGQLTLRGDTDFSHTKHLDRWDKQGVKFILGLDCHAKVKKLAEELPPEAWTRLERLPPYEIHTQPRTRPDRFKEAIVRERGFKNVVLLGEDVAHLDYRPEACEKTYRLVIVRKNLSVQRGERELFEDVRYFFYLTNRTELDDPAVVGLANGRCDQENVVAQLKHGVNAMRMPVDDLNSNWAYMLITALAWNLKAWFALLVPDRERWIELLKMEFRTFLQAIMLLPAQIVRGARKIVWRILTYNLWLKDLCATFEWLMNLETG